MYYDFIKRVLDIVGAMVGLILCSPLLVLTAIAIKLDPKGPVMAPTMSKTRFIKS
jgi:lipopolysaccharide/colanic/teichoic acid biosynthesis glycosyltransferase